MDTFYEYWLSIDKYWFNQNDNIDKYLSITYGSLIDEYEYKNSSNLILGILIYDQLTRHYYRNEYNNHILVYFNNKALEIANKNKTDDFIKNLNYIDWSFYMLVYRHSNIKENLLFVMNECWKLSPLPIKFIKATFTRANFTKETLDYYNKDPEIFDKSILDNNPLIEISKSKFYNIGQFDKINAKTIIISLSGGVDSVVCLFNVIHTHPDKKIIAIHINYNNRIEVEEEVKFLRCLCCELNIELYVRKISEIKRNICMLNDLRDLYESYTKKIRFNSYKSLEEPVPTVILGHNKDDCFENILTNIAYNSKYENLLGVEYKSQIDNIIFIRPLINVSKDAIYKFANKHNLPYLKNSTPRWSQRGKIRTDIIPALNKWDDRIINGLFHLSDVMKDYNEILKRNIENFKEKEIEKLEKLNMSKLYWKHGIFKLFNIYISNKSLDTLIERLELWKNKYNSIDVNKKTFIILSKSIQIMIMKKNDDKYELNIIKICQLKS
jgi:tRNA(Ile)-lysidine synthetase-like protein